MLHRRGTAGAKVDSAARLPFDSAWYPGKTVQGDRVTGSPFALFENALTPVDPLTIPVLPFLEVRMGIVLAGRDSFVSRWE